MPSRRPTTSGSGDSLEGGSDLDMLAAVADGKHQVFDAFVERYGMRVRHYVSQLLGPRGSAEDLTQDVFVKVFHLAQRGKVGRNIAVWLFRVAHNHAIGFLRREAVHERALSSWRTNHSPEGGAVRTPLRELEVREVEDHIQRALDQLPETFRAPFLLRENEGLGYEEIAEIVGSTPKTVSTRIFRARMRLRGLLAPLLGDAGVPGSESGRAMP